MTEVVIGPSAARDPSPLGRRCPEGADERAFATSQKEVAPHQLGQMTYGSATEDMPVATACRAAVSHGLASSPPRGEGRVL
jgi:hypothetical protein